MEELHVYAPQFSACNSERMVKIGAELPKLLWDMSMGGVKCNMALT